MRLPARTARIDAERRASTGSCQGTRHAVGILSMGSARTTAFPGAVRRCAPEIVACIHIRSPRLARGYAWVASTLGSCFNEAGFTRVSRLKPEPISPQADAVELTARFLRFFAAFTSRSWCAPQDGQSHSRTDNARASRTAPHAEQVFDEGDGRGHVAGHDDSSTQETRNICRSALERVPTA
jgi:hypothetical protein